MEDVSSDLTCFSITHLAPAPSASRSNISIPEQVLAVIFHRIVSRVPHSRAVGISTDCPAHCSELLLSTKAELLTSVENQSTDTQLMFFENLDIEVLQSLHYWERGSQMIMEPSGSRHSSLGRALFRHSGGKGAVTDGRARNRLRVSPDMDCNMLAGGVIGWIVDNKTILQELQQLERSHLCQHYPDPTYADATHWELTERGLEQMETCWRLEQPAPLLQPRSLPFRDCTVFELLCFFG